MGEWTTGLVGVEDAMKTSKALLVERGWGVSTGPAEGWVEVTISEKEWLVGGVVLGRELVMWKSCKSCISLNRVNERKRPIKPEVCSFYIQSPSPN
jgi:hypothetical protein